MSVNDRCGLILAAGFGSRLAGTVSSTSLKPLTPVGGIPLIFRTIRSLEIAGCTKVCIVLGYHGDEIRSEIEQEYKGSTPLIFVTNDRYDLKNGVSVLAAKNHLSDPFIMTMADHVLGDSVMELAGAHTPPSNGATLLVDYKIDTIFDMDDATKVLANSDANIVSIGKEIAEFNCIDTGVFVCTFGLIEALDAFYAQNGDASLSEGVQYLSKTGKMSVLDIEDGFWQDVDTPEMLKHAEAYFSR
jgi:1L-myo-inositol 1-phosphate cytidylyltransferase